MPSVNPIQAPEPRIQPASKQRSPSGDPFAEMLESAENKRPAREETRAERSTKRDQPTASASRSKTRTDALERGDQPKGEVGDGRRGEAKPAEEATKADAPAVEDAAPADASESGTDDQQAETANDMPETPAVSGAETPVAVTEPATEAGSPNLAPTVTTETASAATEGEAAPKVEPAADTAKPTAPTTGTSPETARADQGLEEAPVAAAPKVATAPQPVPDDAGAETAEIASAPTSNGRAVTGGQGQARDVAAASQNKTPVADPTPAAVPEGEKQQQLAQQQNSAPQAQAKPQESAGTRPTEPNAPAPTAADSASPKVQSNSAQNPPVPESVRAMSASFDQGRFSLSSGTEVKPTPLNVSSVAVEIVSRMRDGLKRFDIRLDPPELGRVDVRLEVDRNGNVSTKLTVDRPETLDLMQRDARALERALQQAGLKTDSGGLEFSLRQHADERFAQGQGNSGRNDMHAERAVAEGGEPAEAVVQGYYRASAFSRGGVDITV